MPVAPLAFRLGVVAATVAGLAGALAPAGAAASQAPHSASPGHWAQVTTPLVNVAIIPEIGLVRGSDGILHVLWRNGQSPSYRIMDAPITRTGAVRHPVVVAKGWFIADDPDATATPSGLDVLWNGAKTSNSNTPQGTFVATRPRSGGNWTVSGTVIPPLTGAPVDSTDAAATGSDGKPWVAYYGTDSLVVDHFGHPPVQLAPATKCCFYNAALATDSKTGTTWVGYLSLVTHNQGIFVRPLRSTGAPLSPAKLLPGSRAHGNVIPAAERVALTGRGPGHPGVYVLYGIGYPFYTKLALLRVGARTPTTLARFSHSRQLAEAAIAADHRGRLWAAWIDGRGTRPALFVRRSNTAGGAFGPVRQVRLPAGTTTVWKVYVNAQAGRLDVVALITRNNRDKNAAYWATEVLPPRR